MSNIEIIEKIKETLKGSNIFNEDCEFDSSKSLIEDYGISSMQLINVIMLIEREFEIEFEDEYLLPENFITIESIADIVASIIN